MFSQANEDVLQRLRDEGDTLDVARGIDFTVVFPDEASAKTFAKRFYADYRVAIKMSRTREDRPWDVTVTRRMVPTNEDITAFEALLQAAAEPSGGVNDGWGCFGQ